MLHYSKTVIGLDVHKESIVAAILPPDSDRIALTTKFENTPGALKSFVERLRARQPLSFVYEAGPCGYQVHRDLTAQGEECVVIAPGLVPKCPGDKVKTDRRDADRLAQLYRAGQLTAVRVPTRAEEADRDLVRAREDVLAERLRARHRIAKFLLRQGLVWRETKPWTLKHRAWLRSLRFEFESQTLAYEAGLRGLEETEARLAALDRSVDVLGGSDRWKGTVANLRCLKGVDTLTALTMAVEVGDFRRFGGAVEFMGYTGLVSREHSSGESVRRFRITKMGNAHLRRVLVEAAWSYTQRDCTGPTLTRRRESGSPEAIATARRAQERLCGKFRKLTGKGKPRQKAVVAVARELAGFVWHIGRISQEG
ncbi:MAG: IS110 family transposase [Elusimicrobiota bacterium]|jgi:transposase